MVDATTGVGDTSTVGTVVDALGERLSNWGRWGNDDELGTLNLITEDVRRRARECVRTGQAVSLALPLVPEYPQIPGGGRFNSQHVMTETGTDALAQGAVAAYSDDAIAMSVHGHTHWDALAHVFHRGRMFNDRSAAMVTAQGAAANDVRALARTMVTRGVLLDLAPHGGVLPRDHEITVIELQQAADRQQVTIREGDALLLRTGHLGAIRRSGRWVDFSGAGDRCPFEPGIGHACLPWLHERRVAAVASDNWAVEVLNGSATERMPVHEVAVVHMGMPLGEIFDLDALSALCAADGHWDFLLCASPLPITGAVGGPVNPMAIR